jgi:hypothetical protein
MEDSKTITIIIIIILLAVFIAKVADIIIEWYFQNERLKIEQSYQEERTKQDQAFLDYLKNLSELYVFNK